MDLFERRTATLRTLQRFTGHPFTWGKYDCGKMLISHLREMGHRPRIGPGGSWRNPVGLARFLRRHGGSGAACLDGWGLPRIPPATVLVGDILEMAGEPPFGAFAVALDNGRGRIMGYHEDEEGLAVAQAIDVLNAWRV